jgi:predicted metal-dependent peptidase
MTRPSADAGGIFDDTRQYIGMSTDQIYVRITPPEPPPPPPPTTALRKWTDDVIDTPQEDRAEVEQVWTQLRNDIRAAGLGSADLREILQDEQHPCTWQDRLAMFAARTGTSDYTWTRPSRRHLERGVYLPTLKAPEPWIIIAIDTSGSISPRTVNHMIIESVEAVQSSRVAGEIWLWSDTLHSRHPFATTTPPDMPTNIPSGGTRFAPVLEAVADLPEPPSGLVILTDLAIFDRAQWQGQPPNCPVLWLDFDGGQPAGPFGETVQMPRY